MLAPCILAILATFKCSFDTEQQEQQNEKLCQELGTFDTLRHDSAFSQFSASAVTRLGFSIG